LQANPAFLDDNAEKTKGWYPSGAAEQDARSIFLVQKRNLRVPFLETFDQPENSVSCPCRSVSVVAPQAFSLLNSPLAVRAAKALAERVQDEAGDDRRRQVRQGYCWALQREPSDHEAAVCERFLEERSLVELCRALLNLNEFVYLD
jgi:hypothetical protein